MKETVANIFGKEYKIPETVKLTAEIINGKARLHSISIYGYENHTTLSDVEPEKFVESIKKHFSDHNNQVDKLKEKIRQDSINYFKEYCSKKETANERKAFLLSVYQANTYEVKNEDNLYRLDENYFTVFNNIHGRYNAIDFPVTNSEFKELQTAFVNFKN
jgi:hypothetical protein